MRLFNKFNGVPNSHLFILIIYICLLLLTGLLTVLYVIQDLLNGPILNLGISIIGSHSWMIPLIIAGIFTVIIIITDVLYIHSGNWSKYQVPLHKIVKAFYIRSDSPYVNSDGQIINLSSTEISKCNLAIKCTYLMSFNDGLKLIIPCSRRGLNKISNDIIDSLRNRQGSLDSAQHLISSNFPDYRFRISQHTLVGHKIVWYLTRK